MSIARPTALIRRAVALPKGLLDRIDSSLDAILNAGFVRVDAAVDRRIRAVADRTHSISQGLARSAETFDRALNQRVTSFDLTSNARVAKTKVSTSRFTSAALNFEARTDAKLNRSLHTFDRATDSSTRAAIATMNASVALTHRADNRITRGFNRVDIRATNVANRAHSRRIKTANLVVRAATRIDQRIETDFLRADTRVNAGINHSVNAIETTIARTLAVTNATDTRISNAVTRVDARIDRRIQQSVNATATTLNLVNTKALAFERAMDLGISRADSRIANGHARALATSHALTNGVNSADQALTSAYARVDARVDNRIAQTSYAYAQAATFATNRVAATDARLETSVANFDTRVNTGVATLVSAATGISNFVVDHVEDADSALTNRMSRIDARVDAFIDLTHGESAGATNRPTSSLPWAATSLTLVLGTLGAATGASVVSATVTGELDTTVRIEATAAKDAVNQYLSVRESFQAAQASRSRTIQTLEQEIAAAQARITETGLDGASVIEVADNFGGVPYVRGGTTPRGFDCSGYTQYVFRQLGVKLPRVSSAQHAWADKVRFEDRQVGDLMFWANGGGVHHVAIYAGDGKMWDSPRPGRRVGKTSIWGNPTYGRVPVEVVNATALAEVAEKTAALEEAKAAVPQLEITIDPQNLLPSSE
jgi:cell wall-associated NlpC family hydrolase